MDTRDYIEVASFPTSFEASLARNLLETNGIPAFLGGEAMASWFWQYGTAIGGVRLLVEHGQLSDAQQLLNELKQDKERYATEEDAWGDLDRAEPSELPPELLRAWRAAIISLVFFPVLLNVYSTYLVTKNQFFVDSGGQTNWRVPVAMLINICVFCAVLLFFYLLFAPRTTAEWPMMPH